MPPTPEFLGLIGKIAWPIVTLIIFFTLRATIVDLARRVKLVKAKDMHFELVEKIEQATRGAREISPDVVALDDSDIQGVKRSRTASILEKWAELASEIHRTAVSVGKTQNKGNILSDVERLRKVNRLAETEVEIFTRLYEIRNIALHDSDPSSITEAIAIEYARLVNQLITRLRSSGR